MKTVCVYCGSSDKMSASYLEAARQMGMAIAGRGLGIVYGAGCTGMMGALADGALEAGGEVVGVIPELFATPQLMHTRLTRLEVVDNMHTRKARLAELADAFIAMPGGYGTFEELFEMLTWAQIGLHSKPVGLFNVLAYFDPLLELVEHARREGFMYAEHRDLLVSASQPDALLDVLGAYRPPVGLDKWLTRTE